MADNIPITAGAGTTVATDEVSNVHYQIVKIATGTLEQTALAGGGIVIAQTPTITAGAYSAKDAVGGKLTFANAVLISGGKSLINSLTIVDEGDIKAGLELWLFNQDFTANNDNDPFDPSDADSENLVGVIPISTADYFSAADNGCACIRGVGLEFQLVSTTSLYGQLKCTGTPTYAETDGLTIKLAIEYLD